MSTEQTAEPHNPVAADIEVAGLSARFRLGRERIRLSYADFSVGAGEQAVITGPSGSGKSTLLHLLAGLIPAASGTIRVGAHQLDRMGERARDAYRARNIGYLFQDFHLQPDFTAAENIVLGLGLAGVAAAERRGRALQVLERVDLKRHAHRPVRRMSTGERQRVALARSVAHRPGLLLADEPTAHLDRTRADQAMELLRETAAGLGISLLVATHDPAVMDTFDKRIEVGA